ncbi:MAG: hypothetical protein HKN87_14955 [Saprospiraceae bacterium]|nr:hypothetical protein [Saprospiraceae bacterium]
MKQNSVHWFVIVGMILVAAMSRFIPHWHNFTAVGAMGLFGAAYLNKRHLSFIIPLLALWISDLILNNTVYGSFHEGFVWFTDFSIFVYAGFLLVVLVGHILLKKISFTNVLAASVVASLVFFLVSNFGSFMLDPMYPKTASGLGAAYLAGIPFFWNSLLANIFYSFVLIGSYELISQKFLPALSQSS